MKTGVELIAAERTRQVEVEGWTLERDAEHIHGQLACAAHCYALPHHLRPFQVRHSGQLPLLWPWTSRWKLGNRIHELTKAGALIAAEIDRLQNV